MGDTEELDSDAKYFAPTEAEQQRIALVSNMLVNMLFLSTDNHTGILQASLGQFIAKVAAARVNPAGYDPMESLCLVDPAKHDAYQTVIEIIASNVLSIGTEIVTEPSDEHQPSGLV